jgi:sortase B
MRIYVIVISILIIIASWVIIAAASGGEAEIEVELRVNPGKSIDFEVSSARLIADIPPPERNTEILSQWQTLHDENSDLVGWLKIGDTIVNYPVVQYIDNYHYLHHSFAGRRHSDGTLFVDWHTPVTDSRRPDNTVIYGHNMRSGRKFHHLINYYAPRHGLDEYLKNPTIDFTTIYDDSRNTYKIFAAMYVNTIEEHGEVFNYFRQRFFNSRDEFFEFIGNVLDRSVFYTDVDIQYGDEILTLSTCYFPLGNETDRFVLLARRVREGESGDVDTSLAYINESPLYFDHYYSRKGGSWAGRSWDLSKVKGFEGFKKDA